MRFSHVLYNIFLITKKTIVRIICLYLSMGSGKNNIWTFHGKLIEQSYVGLALKWFINKRKIRTDINWDFYSTTTWDSFLFIFILWSAKRKKSFFLRKHIITNFFWPKIRIILNWNNDSWSIKVEELKGVFF